MKEIELYRKEIDEIDSKIIDLFEQRMDIVKKVIDYKIKNNLPILDSSRESIMLENNLKKFKKDDYKIYYHSVLNGYLTSSKDLQKDILNKK